MVLRSFCPNPNLNPIPHPCAHQEASLELANSRFAPRGKLVFGAGLSALLFVPAFKSLTGLPPYMGMLLGLGGLWLLTDAIHYGE